jgi:hypothetical protein
VAASAYAVFVSGTGSYCWCKLRPGSSSDSASINQLAALVEFFNTQQVTGAFLLTQSDSIASQIIAFRVAMEPSDNWPLVCELAQHNNLLSIVHSLASRFLHFSTKR